MARIDDLRSQYETLAKRANQRLRQLERSGVAESSRAYQVTARNVYDQKQGYATTRAGNIAFSRSTKGLTESQLASRIANVENFLGGSTTTVSGYKSSLQKAYSSFMKGKGKGSGLSFKEYQELFSSNVTKTYGYGNVLAIGRATGKNVGQTLKAMENVIAEQANDKKVLGQKNMIAKIQKSSKRRKRK